MAGRLADHFPTANPDVSLGGLCAQGIEWRSHLAVRALIAATDREGIVRRLREEAAGQVLLFVASRRRVPVRASAASSSTTYGLGIDASA